MMNRNRIAVVLTCVLLGAATVACDAEVDVPEGEGVQLEGEEGGEGEGDE